MGPSGSGTTKPFLTSLLGLWRRKSVFFVIIIVVVLIVGAQYSYLYHDRTELFNEINSVSVAELSSSEKAVVEVKKPSFEEVKFVAAPTEGNIHAPSPPKDPLKEVEDERTRQHQKELLANGISREDVVKPPADDPFYGKKFPLFALSEGAIVKKLDHPMVSDQPAPGSVSAAVSVDNGVQALPLKSTKVPYIPTQRLIHFDLKGAPPTVSYMKKIFPMIKQLGATGVLMEWEDMFPFRGQLSNLAARNRYSKKEVREILSSLKENSLDIIPLIQTFGHLEFALKHDKFKHLRELPAIPQALCPSRNESHAFLHEMIDQVMLLHKDAGLKYLHIGCDEVFVMGECDICRQNMKDNLFLEHVASVATYVRNKYKVVPLIWDDMLRHLLPSQLQDYHLGQLVEPMVWVYAEDVYRFVPSSTWDKFAAVFPTVWAASAFKGAFGETLDFPNANRHLDNNLRWLSLMSNESPKFRNGFQGIAITGWQRYDHFATLCETLPASLPSLALSLVSISNGYFNQSLLPSVYKALTCNGSPSSRFFDSSYNNPTMGFSDVLTPSFIQSDPFLFGLMTTCFFPGSQFFRLTSQLDTLEKDVDAFLKDNTRSKAWLTQFNERHNFTSLLRIDEALTNYPHIERTVAVMIPRARDALGEAFDVYTVAEWIEQKLYPLLERLHSHYKTALSMKERNVWPARPFDPLPALARYGITPPPQPPQKGRGRKKGQKGDKPKTDDSVGKSRPDVVVQ